jgi:tetratricopeptide (TPR) repeat protein
LGAAQIAGNDIAGAVESLREAVAICQSAGNKAGELAAQKHLGAVTRDKERAYRHHQRALVLARELNDAPVEAESLLELARCVHALCRWDEARCLLQECFELQLRLKDSVGVAWCVLEIGVLQIHVGALPQGEKNVKEALKRFSAGGSDEGLAATHHALGKLAARRGDRRTAQREFANADRIAGPVSNGGDFIVAPSTRPRRMWHPTG